MATIQLARSQSAPRQFPPISTDFYQKDHPLLLLVVHREAMQAEISGDWSSATYLWGYVLAEAKTLYPRAELWADFGGDATRFAFYTEILADSHLAFYNGSIEFVSTQARAKYHQALAEDYLGLAGISK